MAAIIRAAFGYILLIFMVRVAGRRPGKQITPFEFVLVFFSGGLTLTFMVADDRSMTNAFTQVLTLALCHTLITIARQKFPRFAVVMDGTPLVLLKNGQWQMETMKRMRIQDDDVMAMARDQELKRLDQIEYAILERNGEISIIPKEEEED